MDKKVVIEGYNRFKHKVNTEGINRTLERTAIVGMSYINFILKAHKYPQNLIFITGLGKSGSTWICNIFSSLDGFNRFTPLGWNMETLDLYPTFFNEFKNRLAVVKGHTWGTYGNVQMLKDSGLKYVVTVKGP